MGARRAESKLATVTSIHAPAITPQQRENQIVNAAMDLAERQILAGTASSQVITHFLKLGSSREGLEQYKIEMENDLLVTKREILESEKRTEELYREALKAMSMYQGNEPEEDDPDDDYEG